MIIQPPRQNHSIILLGKKGTGKTSLARTLLLTQANAIICDTKKNEKEWTKIGKIFRGDPWKRGSGRWVWQPSDDWLNDVEKRNYDLEKLYRVGKRVLYFDEIADLCRGGRIPPMLMVIPMRGRSADLGFWGTTQRPYKIPLEVLSEADCIGTFYLALARDRQRAEELFEQRLAFHLLGRPDEHKFFWRGKDGQVIGPLFLEPSSIIG